jgi:tRNA nucleotidyltransferase/poly(A) polymerase
MLSSLQRESREYIQKICQLLEGQQDIYLVGGSVRDLLLQRPIHDLDLVMAGDVRPVARRVANAVGGAFYMLDEERNTARVIDRHAAGGPVVLDFAHCRSNDLERDLWARDFTMNAMALRLGAQDQLIDPTGGARDVRAGVVRACTPSAMESDAVRVLRGTRLAVMLGFRIEPETFRLMRQAVPLLNRITWERKRDELFRMLEGAKVSTSLRILDRLNALEHLLPEFTLTKGVSQSPAHTLPVYEHTLLMLDCLAALWDVLVEPYEPDRGANLFSGIATLQLGRFRKQLAEHYRRSLNPNRSLRSLLFLAAVYHDVGKPATQTTEVSGRIRFYRHEQISAELASARGRTLVLSQAEIQRLTTLVKHHMRVHLLAYSDELPSRRAVYRYFRALGPAGVDVCLLSLADLMATSGSAMPVDVWQREVDICRILLESWLEKPEVMVSPPKIISGSDIVRAFPQVSGPVIGRLLEAVQEAQAAGAIDSRHAALEYVERWLRSENPAAVQGENENDGE